MHKLYFILILVFLSSSVKAWDTVGPTKIKFVENGWNGEGLAFHSDSGISGVCTSADNDFGIAASHPAYKEMVSIAITAFTTQSNVELIVDPDNCVFGARTNVWAIRLVR